MAVKKPKISLSSIVEKSKDFEKSILNPNSVKENQHIEPAKPVELAKEIEPIEPVKPVELAKEIEPIEPVEEPSKKEQTTILDYEIINILNNFIICDSENYNVTCPLTTSNKVLLKTICTAYKLAGKKMTIQTLLHNIIETWKKNNADDINTIKKKLLKNM